MIRSSLHLCVFKWKNIFGIVINLYGYLKNQIKQQIKKKNFMLSFQKNYKSFMIVLQTFSNCTKVPHQVY